MKLLGGTKSNIAKNENGENVPYLETTAVASVYSYIVNNNYQENSRVLQAFVPNKLFGKLLDISPKNLILLNTFDSEFSYNEFGLLIKIINHWSQKIK